MHSYAQDFSVTAPFESPIRSTCSAGDDCFLTDAPDHLYEVVIPTSGDWVFSTCGEQFDTYIFIGSSLCTQDIASSDDACAAASEVVVNIPAGTYYVTVEGYESTECGDYQLSVEEDESTSVENTQLINTYKIYPNPTNGLFYVDKNTTQNISYEITDILGNNIVKMDNA